MNVLINVDRFKFRVVISESIVTVQAKRDYFKSDRTPCPLPKTTPLYPFRPWPDGIAVGFVSFPVKGGAAASRPDRDRGTTDDFAETQVPAQGAVQVVHGAQAPGDGGRGEHQRPVPVPCRARVPVASHRRGRDTEQELFGGEYPHVQRLLHAAVIVIAVNVVVIVVVAVVVVLVVARRRPIAIIVRRRRST